MKASGLYNAIRCHGPVSIFLMKLNAVLQITIDYGDHLILAQKRWRQ